MLSHSTLDDIEYSKYSYLRRKSLKKRHRHRHHRSKKSRKSFNNYEADKCAVCLDDATTLDTKLFPCGHTFHGKCLIQWVTVQKGQKFNCPLCRQDIAHFIQMTGNQQINEQLIQIWNEHYLYNTSSKTSQNVDKSGPHKSKDIAVMDEPVKSAVKSVECVPVITDKIKTITIESERVEIAPNVKVKVEIEASVNENVATDDNIAIVNSEQASQKKTENIKMDISVHNKSDCSIWKFLWNSPFSMLYIQRKKDSIYSAVNMLNYLLYPSLHSIYDMNNMDHPNSNSDMHVSNTNCAFPAATLTFMQNTNTNAKPTAKQPMDTPNMIQSNHKLIRNNDLLLFSIFNFQSGLFAGVCAGLTTYLMSRQITYEVHKGFANGLRLQNTLYPILAETVPNVAIFFTSYEHLKRYLFDTNNIENSYYQTFTERFISAGLAAQLSYFITNGGTSGPKNGLLPFRFATFFGTFEFCKDLMHCKHENIGLFGIASAATIGGTVSHGLYYPLLQYKNMFVMDINKVPLVTNMNCNEQMGYEMYHIHANNSKQMVARNLFKGWISSLSKFLPSCVVCSCAFEYSKRFFNT